MELADSALKTTEIGVRRLDGELVFRCGLDPIVPCTPTVDPFGW